MKRGNKKILLFTIIMLFSLTFHRGNIAKANDTITVTIDLDGGSYGGKESYTITGTKGSTTLLGTPTKNGYVLSGYRYSQGSLKLVSGANYLYTFGSKDETITALWEIYDESKIPEKPTAPPVTPNPTAVPTVKPTVKPTVIPSPKFSISSNPKKIKSSPYTITNKRITLKISKENVKNVRYKIVSSTYETDWKQVNGSTLTIHKTLKKAQIYFQYTTLAGKNIIVKTNKFTLDKTAPKISGVKNTKIYQENVRVTFKDTGSGIKRAKLNGTSIKNGKTIRSNGTYYLEVTDNAGNTKKIVFTMKKKTKKPNVIATKTPITTPVPISTFTPAPTPRTIQPQKIKLSKNHLTLIVNSSATLTTTILPTNASNRNIVWKSCNSKIATVNNNGKIVAKGKGSTTIIAYSKANSNISVCCTIIVQ